MDKKLTVPTAYIWRESGLYLGATYIPARDIKLTSDQLIICLEGNVVTTRSDGSQFTSRSFLLKAGTINKASNFDSTSAIVAIYYLNATSQDFSILQTLMKGSNEGIHYDLEHEGLLIETFLRLRDEKFSAEDAHQTLREALIPESMRNSKIKDFDERIVKVINRIEQTADKNLTVRELAEEVYLSESRLVKLFKAQIGIPITRYRLRFRVSLGATYMAMGCSVTDAALLSGFASTAHFSKCYVAIMGIQPSTAFLHSPFLNIIIADSILQSLKEKSRALVKTNQATPGSGLKDTQ